MWKGWVGKDPGMGQEFCLLLDWLQQRGILREFCSSDKASALVLPFVLLRKPRMSSAVLSALGRNPKSLHIHIPAVPQDISHCWSSTRGFSLLPPPDPLRGHSVFSDLIKNLELHLSVGNPISLKDRGSTDLEPFLEIPLVFFLLSYNFYFLISS